MAAGDPVLPPLQLGDYKVVRSRDNLLGKGGFGHVWRGHHVHSLDHVAVKQVEKNDRTKRFLERELLFLKQFNHENIVKVFATQETDTVAYFIMEYCRLGNLSKHLKRNAVSITDCTGFMMDVVRAMIYLHCEKQICHRDVKPDNVLLTNDGAHAKLADFGLARESPQSSTPVTGSGVGTYGWWAPEVLQITDGARRYSYPADIFSLGLLFLAMIILQVPRSRTGNLHPYGVDGVPLGHWLKARADGQLPQIHRPNDENSITALVKDLILRMLCLDAEERYTIEEIYNHIQRIHEAAIAEHNPPQEICVIDEGANNAGSPPSQVELVCRHDLAFRADDVAGFSSDGRIVLSCADELLLYQLINTKYRQLWNKAVPPGMSSSCYKTISRTGELLLQPWEEGSVTARYTHDLYPIAECDRRGVLLDCLHDGLVAYGRGTLGKYDWKVEVWREAEEGERVTALRHPATQGRLSRLVRHGWGWLHSLCTGGDRIVVVENMSKVMDIFTKQGERVSHHELDYEPAWRKAVTMSGEDRILVVGFWPPASIHVHKLDGEEVCTLRHHQLHLADDVRVQGICCTEDGMLILAAGHGLSITSLFAYKLHL